MLEITFKLSIHNLGFFLAFLCGMIETRALTKNYGGIEVLKGVDLLIQKGEIVSIVGASGAGKSTLLHILGMLDKPSGGKLIFQDQEISSLSDKALAQFRNKHIGFIFQFHNLLPEFTAIENVCIPGFILKKSESEARKRASELLDLLGLGHRLEHKPSQLSGGEQQRVAVARALMNAPEVIFADEPSGNLDSQNAKDLHKLFFDLRKDFGQTFVIVTHNEELAKMADRTLFMKDGKVL